MILALIAIIIINALIWLGIKRSISHYIREHERYCRTSLLPGGSHGQPKRLEGKPWTQEPKS